MSLFSPKHTPSPYGYSLYLRGRILFNLLLFLSRFQNFQNFELLRDLSEI